ncbi:60S ribosomal protein L5 [Aduncisulcus paluster]|uniref:60S ribosomal protein L5 n=1 Tax=Aduncisulcus paluster TaxID=2918883 RepID=A0ABQ5KPF6_9EUKA|nr:60S ribosomal protein L5 [Aduncisulcus paluster]
MVFTRVIKSKGYFKRYQTQFRRRFEGKTDYQQRRAMIVQDKDKYGSPKYRFVVRITNKDIICQVVYSEIEGDRVLAAAYAHELPRYGIPVGLTNYPAAYATGLLLARRLLKKVGLDKDYAGVEDVDGKEYHVEPEGERRPFKCHLDIGLRRSTTGARVFGALKGAVDGGLNIPHSVKRFPGFSRDEEEHKKTTYDAEAHCARIFGADIAEYMTTLKEEEPEKYQKKFSNYIKANIEAENLESMYEEAHEAIRKNPEALPKKTYEGKPKSYKTPKITAAERKARVIAKKQALIMELSQ